MIKGVLGDTKGRRKRIVHTIIVQRTIVLSTHVPTGTPSLAGTGLDPGTIDG